MAFPFVQGASNSGNTINTLAAAYASNIGAGKRLLVIGVLDQRTATGATCTPSDTLTSTWTQRTTANGNGFDITIYDAFAAVAGGANTVTVNYGGVNQATLALFVHEYADMLTAAAFDAAASATGNSAALNSGNITTAKDGEIVFGWGVSGVSAVTVGTNETFLARVAAGTGGTEDVVKMVAGTSSAQFSATAGIWWCAVAAYKRRIFAPPTLDGLGSYGAKGHVSLG